jgi:hypothetical protein
MHFAGAGELRATSLSGEIARRKPLVNLALKR